MNILLWIGSCRPRCNTGAMARFLQSEMRRSQVAVHQLDLKDHLGVGPLPDEVIAGIRASDAIVLLAPVYLDTLPAPILELLVRLHEQRDALAGSRPAFYAVVHSGYLEPVHRVPALETCAHFGRAMGFDWRGGIGFGGTSPIGGAPLENLGWLTKNLRASLVLLAQAVRQGQPVPARALALAKKRPVPLPLRAIVATLNLITKRQLRAKGIHHPWARPYQNDKPSNDKPSNG